MRRKAASGSDESGSDFESEFDSGFDSEVDSGFDSEGDSEVDMVYTGARPAPRLARTRAERARVRDLTKRGRALLLVLLGNWPGGGDEPEQGRRSFPYPIAQRIAQLAVS